MRWFALFCLSACGSLESPNAPSPTATGSGAGGPATGAPSGTATGGAWTGSGDCAPHEEWDDEARHPEGTADVCADAAIPLQPVDDSGASPVRFTGNLHEAGDVDWFVVDAIDTAGDAARGYEDFRLDIRITAGNGSVEMLVVPLDCANTAEAETHGLHDEFSWYSEDTSPDHLGRLPADLRACGAPGQTEYNDCPDYSGQYLVRITSADGGPVCDPYEIAVSNGRW